MLRERGMRRQKQEQERQENRLDAEQRERYEKERLEAQRRQLEEKDQLKAERREREEKERLEAERRKRGSTSPGKRTWLSVAGVVAVLALVVVAPILYIGSQRAYNVEKALRMTVEAATKDHPWVVNSLGMKFVPVAGTQVLFSVWDTRVEDFEAFVKSTGYDATAGMYSLGKDGFKQRGATWKKPGFSQGANHPVVGVSWNDAEEFCKWLTKRERSAGDLPQDREYRLPKDEEWSAAVGLKNELGSTPEEKSGKIKLYPWDIPRKRDKSWPPPAGAGNYAGGEAKNADWPSDFQVIEGYNDGYPRTSPVGSFEANFSGLYDMGGNVWQWCEDWHDATEQYRVLRGGSWGDSNPDNLLASYRTDGTSDRRYAFVGFRCVVAVESSR
jgi:formylglycine-generating enzyme required for sulfatase activity